MSQFLILYQSLVALCEYYGLEFDEEINDVGLAVLEIYCGSHLIVFSKRGFEINKNSFDDE